jgi:hypothetical protein
MNKKVDIKRTVSLDENAIVFEEKNPVLNFQPGKAYMRGIFFILNHVSIVTHMLFGVNNRYRLLYDNYNFDRRRNPVGSASFFSIHRSQISEPLWENL